MTLGDVNTIGSGFARSGSSPGASNDSFVCSGGSPGIGSGFSFSGNSPTRSLIHSPCSVVLTQQFHSKDFRTVEVLRTDALVCALAEVRESAGEEQCQLQQSS